MPNHLAKIINSHDLGAFQHEIAIPDGVIEKEAMGDTPTTKLHRKEPAEAHGSDGLRGSFDNLHAVKASPAKPKTTFLDLPREIRQNTIVDTITDKDLLSLVAIKVARHTPDTPRRLITGYAQRQILRETTQYVVGSCITGVSTGPGLDLRHQFVEALMAIYPLVTEDMEWVRKQWVKRAHFLGSKKMEFIHNFGLNTWQGHGNFPFVGRDGKNTPITDKVDNNMVSDQSTKTMELFDVVGVKKVDLFTTDSPYYVLCWYREHEYITWVDMT